MARQAAYSNGSGGDYADDGVSVGRLSCVKSEQSASSDYPVKLRGAGVGYPADYPVNPKGAGVDSGGNDGMARQSAYSNGSGGDYADDSVSVGRLSCVTSKQSASTDYPVNLRGAGVGYPADYPVNPCLLYNYPSPRDS